MKENPLCQKTKEFPCKKVKENPLYFQGGFFCLGGGGLAHYTPPNDSQDGDFLIFGKNTKKIPNKTKTKTKTPKNE